MKHAYLIIAHNQFEQLKFLVSLLDHVDNDIFLMIDGKVPNEVVEDLKKEMNVASGQSNIHFTPRVKIFWGGGSQIEAEMTLFKTASQYDYDYYHLLSGVDLPLVSQEVMHRFFEEHKGKIYLTNVAQEVCEKNHIYDRVKYVHLFSNLHPRNVGGRLQKKCVSIYRKLERKIQKLCQIDYFKKYDLTLGYASNWMSLDRETVAMLLKNEEMIHQAFKYSMIADELFIPTMIQTQGLNDKVYHQQGVTDHPDEFQGNLRYINWWDGSPHTWTDSEKDRKQLEKARAAGHFFSRKFDLEKSPKLKEIIREWTRESI